MEKDDEEYARLYWRGFNKAYLAMDIVPSMVSRVLGNPEAMSAPVLAGMTAGVRQFLEDKRDILLDPDYADKDFAVGSPEKWSECYNKGYAVAQYLPELIPMFDALGVENEKGETVRTAEMDAFDRGVRDFLEHKVQTHAPSFAPPWMSRGSMPETSDRDRPRNDKGRNEIDMD